MQHLPEERYAELADGEISADERAHLESCPACAAEVEAYRRLLALAGDERRRIAPPLTDWSTLSARLHSNGVTRERISREPHVALTNLSLVIRRTAAVLLLVGSGTVMGRMSTGLPVRDALALGPIGTSAATDASGNVVPVSYASADFSSADAALNVLRRAQTEYERAAAYLATHDTSTSEASMENYRTRLAALDRGAETFAQALREAPEDPVLNQYYLATLGAREATLSKLGTALPVGARLSRF